MLKFIIPFFIAVFLSFLAEIRTEGFRVSKLKHDTFVEISNFDLNKNFFYLGRGRQFFVFQSQCGNYVLKFINFNNISYPKIFKYIPFFKNSLNRRDQRWDLTFNSLKLALNLQEETKIKCIHLGRSTQSICIFDKFNRKFILDLDKTGFIIQRKADPFFPTLQKAYEKEGIDGVIKRIDAFLKVINDRISKNIADDDLNIANNMGFVGEEAVIIDIGRLYLDPNLIRKKELLRSSKNLRVWLLNNYPNVVGYLDEKIDMF